MSVKLQPKSSSLVLVSANDFAEEALRLMRKQRLPYVGVLMRDQVIGVVYRSELESVDVRRLKQTDVADWSRPDPILLNR